ncbi:hypothetical protein [Pseudonocardia sp. TMWB2A]|uniref:hypothetical protein n=1 Tax=Pseudonocardia sp. TMWB2A TaxID=687430 RepID=UPI00307E9A51
MRKIIIMGVVLALTQISSAAVAGPRQDKALEAAARWKECVIQYAKRLAPQREPAETLATAAMGMCSEESATFQRLYRESTRVYGLPFSSTASDESLQEGYQLIQAKMRETATTVIVMTRAQ